MLEGIRTNPIIVGAYSTREGVCPMLAAHRAGGRTSLIAFARAWDRLALRGERGRSSRRATRRELLILTAHLEASLLEGVGSSPSSSLASAIAQHHELVARRGPAPLAPAKARPGDPDRARELRSTHGWSWTRVLRRYDDYERVLERLAGDSSVPLPERDPARL